MLTPAYAHVLVDTVPIYKGYRDLRLNIYIPPKVNPPYKTLLYIHGGAFMFGDYTMQATKSNLWPIVSRDIYEKGLAIVTLSYRLATEACFPAQIYDIKGCTRFIRAYGAEYGLASEYLGVIGESAGGYLAAMLALTPGVAHLEGEVGGNTNYSSAVQYGAAIYGIFNMLSAYRQFDPLIKPNSDAEDHTSPLSPEARLLGLDKINLSIPQLQAIAEQEDKEHPHYDKAQLAQIANPAYHLSPKAPPIFLGHGDSDGTVPVQQSIELYGALCRNRTDVTLEIGHKQNHGQNFNPRLKERLVEWIVKQNMLT